MKNLPLSFPLLLSLLLCAFSLNAAELATAKVLSVTGSAYANSADAGNTPITTGTILREGDSVSVSHLSEVELVFSNGSLLTVMENTSLTLRELKQQAFAGNRSYTDLEADPSASQTMLQLNYGKVRANVKKIRSDSKFDIETPLGTAAIRGTVVTVELIYDAERNEMIFRVFKENGDVDVITRYTGAIEFNESGLADKGFEGSAEERTAILQNGQTIVVRLSSSDPYYDQLINAILNYAPFQDEAGSPPVVTPLPAPEFTPEDPGLIVVSEEGPEEPEPSIDD